MPKHSAKKITLVAAMGTNRAIGMNGRMPWHLPAELQHFKQTTLGKAVLMGRKTWQAIGRPLPGRQNIVITRNSDFDAPGADVVGSFSDALAVSKTGELMVIGGGQLYALALPLAQRMVLTMIDLEPVADTWFPEWDASKWKLISEQRFKADENNALAYRIVEYSSLIRL